VADNHEVACWVDVRTATPNEVEVEVEVVE
jgi:hypothetical protein